MHIKLDVPTQFGIASGHSARSGGHRVHSRMGQMPKSTPILLPLSLSCALCLCGRTSSLAHLTIALPKKVTYAEYLEDMRQAVHVFRDQGLCLTQPMLLKLSDYKMSLTLMIPEHADQQYVDMLAFNTTRTILIHATIMSTATYSLNVQHLQPRVTTLHPQDTITRLRAAF